MQRPSPQTFKVVLKAGVILVMACMPDTTPTPDFQKLWQLHLLSRKKTGKYKVCREVHFRVCISKGDANRGSHTGNRQAWQTEAFNEHVLLFVSQLPLAKNLLQEEQAGFAEK